jgi:6-phosphogluconolactonase
MQCRFGLSGETEMKQPIEWDRRRFLQTMGGASLWVAAGSQFGWAAMLHSPARSDRFAYIGAEDGIHVYAIAADGGFLKRQAIASANPVAMAISNNNLYVANGVSEFGNLPRGSVEAYAIDRVTGQLELKNQIPLSLSGILPRDLAISPDGRNVVVAVNGGGAYNVLPIHEDGRLGRVSGILKETGSGPHALQASAHPSAVMFDRVGRVLAADQGSDRLSVFSLNNGELQIAVRREVTTGSGPSSMLIDPTGKRLYVTHALNGSVSYFAYDATQGKILDCQQTVWTSVAGQTASLAIHPSGEMLYTSHGEGIQGWMIAENGALLALPGMAGVQTNMLYATADGKSLLALSRDAVLRMKIDKTVRALDAPVKIASLSRPICMAML